MVAYAYAAQYRDEVDRIALMDAFLPGVGDWKNVWLMRAPSRPPPPLSPKRKEALPPGITQGIEGTFGSVPDVMMVCCPVDALIPNVLNPAISVGSEQLP